MENGQPGQRYVIGGKPTSIEQLLTTLQQVTGVPAPTLRIPYPLLMSFAFVSQNAARLTRSDTLMTVNDIKTLKKGLRHQLISAKAERELGVTFRPLTETICDSAAWFIEQGYAKPKATPETIKIV